MNPRSDPNKWASVQESLLQLLKRSPALGKPYAEALLGHTRWGELAKTSDVPKLKLLTSLALATLLAGEPDLLNDKEFAKDHTQWHRILVIAEEKIASEDAHLLDVIRSSSEPSQPDSSGAASSGEVEETHAPSGNMASGSSSTSDLNQAELLKKLLDSLLPLQSLPSMIQSVLMPRTSQDTASTAPSNGSRNIGPSPSEAARDKNINSMAENLVRGVDKLLSNPSLRTGSTLGDQTIPNRDLQADPSSSSNHTPAPQQSIQYIIIPQDDDAQVNAAPISARMPITLPSVTKKKYQFWAPRLLTDDALRKGYKDIQQAPFPFAAEYFEAAMRAGDRFREAGMTDSDFIDYIGYVRWILKLRANHIWESIMVYDEAFRIEMELDPKRPWTIRPPELERIHLQNKPPSYDYSGAGVKRRSPTQGGETCRNFNKDQCRRGDSCQYVHRCSTCSKQGHPATKCRSNEPPKDQPGQSSSQGAPGGNRA